MIDVIVGDVMDYKSERQIAKSIVSIFDQQRQVGRIQTCSPEFMPLEPWRVRWRRGIRRGQFTEDWAVGVRCEHEAGVKVVDPPCAHGISDAAPATGIRSMAAKTMSRVRECMISRISAFGSATGGR